MVQKFRKKPVVVEALKYEGKINKELCDFVGDDLKLVDDEVNLSITPYIHTLEGDMKVSEGDYIIKGVHGEFYPCKPDIFEKTYEVVENV